MRTWTTCSVLLWSTLLFISVITLTPPARAGDDAARALAERFAGGTGSQTENENQRKADEADMLERGMKSLDPASNSLLFIENVGNLVCPALFDLGERAKVAILSVTEGEDKDAPSGRLHDVMHEAQRRGFTVIWAGAYQQP